MYFFTSDEHYGHKRIIQYSKRPFTSIEEMDDELIRRHNERVGLTDTVIHVGDFTLKHRYTEAMNYARRLRGCHTFLKGSHDRWLDDGNCVSHERWEKRIGDIYVVADHYPGRSWPRSHYGSIQVHGHHHASLQPIGLQYDVGVDNNNFYPVSLDELLVKVKYDPNNCSQIHGDVN